MNKAQSFRVSFAGKVNAPIEQPVSRVARMLALAYFIEREIDAGRVRDYAEVARRLELTNARLAQIADLALLSPRIQEDILLGRLVIDAKRAQRASRYLVWEEQETELAELVAEGPTRMTRRQWTRNE